MTKGTDDAFAWAVMTATGETTGASGLTKREWMAAMAMQGMLANASPDQIHGYEAQYALQFADGLIAALNRPLCPDCKTRFADDGHYDAEHKICPDYERAWSEQQ